ncbi:MAG TPA: hypothetical protein VIV14_01320 [Gammaproteobacteria bacterium]
MSELDGIRENLWATEVDEVTYPEADFRRDLMEQYKLCLEMADRISSRRGAANSFFLTFNTAVVGALGAFFEEIPDAAAVVIYAAAILFCNAWMLLLRSYRNLTSAKFKVIGLLEERLPSSPFYSAEWKALGEGKDWRKYIPLSPIETVVPIGFMVCYLYLAYITIAHASPVA